MVTTRRLEAMPALTTPAADSLLYVLTDPGGTPVDHKIAFEDLIEAIFAGDVPGLSTPGTVSASVFALYGDPTRHVTWGSGNPEGFLVAGIGSLFLDATNGVSYLKRTGAGNTGWVKHLDVSVLDVDPTLSANSDSLVATQKATKAYVDAVLAVANAMVFKGVINCSTNPNYPAADAGWTYRVSVAGKIGGASGVNVEVGDLLICLDDGTASGNQATVGVHWTIGQANLDGAVIGPASSVSANFATFSGTSGKIIQDSGVSLDIDSSFAANSDARVPSQKAVKTAIAALTATDTAWVAPTILNSWANVGGTWAIVRYRRLGGVVYVQGFVSNTSLSPNSANLFVLPAGFRPAYDQIDTDYIYPFQVDAATGAVHPNAAVPASGLMAIGISFPADQ